MGKKIRGSVSRTERETEELVILKESSAYTNRGRPIAELGLRQTRKKLTEVATLATHEPL